MLKSSMLPLYWYTAAVVVAWTVIAVGSLSWNIINERKQSFELAKKEARANFNKAQAFRSWGASHGGVYVPVTEHTLPNPVLPCSGA